MSLWWQTFFSSLSPVLWSLVLLSSVSVGSLFSITAREMERNKGERRNHVFSVLTSFCFFISLLSQCHSSRWCRGLKMSRASLTSMSFFLSCLCFGLMLVSLFLFLLPSQPNIQWQPCLPLLVKERERESFECHDLFFLYCRLSKQISGDLLIQNEDEWIQRVAFMPKSFPFLVSFCAFYSHLPSHFLSLLPISALILISCETSVGVEMKCKRVSRRVSFSLRVWSLGFIRHEKKAQNNIIMQSLCD